MHLAQNELIGKLWMDLNARRHTFLTRCFFKYYPFGCKIVVLLRRFHIVTIDGGYWKSHSYSYFDSFGKGYTSLGKLYGKLCIEKSSYKLIRSPYLDQTRKVQLPRLYYPSPQLGCHLCVIVSVHKLIQLKT
jgi:hypothetical protein